MAVPYWRSAAPSVLLRPFGALILILAQATSAFGALAEPAPTLAEMATRQVVMMIDTVTIDGTAYTADDIVASTSSTTPSAHVLAALGNPLKVQFSIAERLPASYRAKLDPRDPEELMQRYVVLTYGASGPADSALAAINQGLKPRYAAKNQLATFAITAPADTYYPYATSPLNYQWGINDVLHLQSAWDSVKGNAYVGHIDNGIMLGHPELDSTTPWTTPFRAQLSKEFITGTQYAANFANLNGVDEALAKDVNTGVFQYAGHGSHTAGIIAAATNNQSGVAGVCWHCSLIVAKMVADAPMFQSAVYWAVRAGAQVINYSGSISYSTDGAGNKGCVSDPNNPACPALDFAAGRDVVVVAASGNYEGPVDFPALDPRVIAVGGLQNPGYQNGAVLWHESTPQYLFSGTNFGPEQKFVAPARDVLSTVYSNREWNPNTRCGDSTAYGSGAGVGFGICTGTSMAAPFVTGIAALVRSINPLWTRTQVYEYIRQSASQANSRDDHWGYGIPNAGATVSAALAATNRLTPLFALYSATGGDYMYTTAPQAAISAVKGLLPPRVDSTLITYTTIGTTITGYSAFPTLYPTGSEPPPRGQLWIFTTEANPVAPSVPLVPLYRMSYKCGDTTGTPPPCSANPVHVDHTYAVSSVEVQNFISIGYKLDGIEGYIYPTTAAKPTGTVAIYRGYLGSSSADDWAIYPETEVSNMAAQGFRVDLAWTGIIGYAYLNTGSRPTY